MRSINFLLTYLLTYLLNSYHTVDWVTGSVVTFSIRWPSFNFATPSVASNYAWRRMLPAAIFVQYSVKLCTDNCSSGWQLALTECRCVIACRRKNAILNWRTNGRRTSSTRDRRSRNMDFNAIAVISWYCPWERWKCRMSGGISPHLFFSTLE